VRAPARTYPAQVLGTLGVVVDLLGSDIPALAGATTDLVRRHVRYGVLLPHYTALFGVLAQVLHESLGERWTAPTASAWMKAS
jgi:hypothetical protein